MVQGMTRPLGRPLEHASIPYLFTTQGSGNGQQLPFNREQNTNTDQQAEIQSHSVEVLRKEIVFFQKVSDELHQTALTIADLQKVSEDVRDDVSNLDDFFRPIKSYFYWEKHCFDIPICWTFRSVFDTIDQIDKLAEDINFARISIEEVDKTFPKIIAQLKATADDTEALKAKLVNSYGSADLQSLATEQTYRRLDQRRQRLGQVPQRRLLLHPARGLRQRRRQNRRETDDVPGRQGSPLHRHPRG